MRPQANDTQPSKTPHFSSTSCGPGANAKISKKNGNASEKEEPPGPPHQSIHEILTAEGVPGIGPKGGPSHTPPTLGGVNPASQQGRPYTSGNPTGAGTPTPPRQACGTSLTGGPGPLRTWVTYA